MKHCKMIISDGSEEEFMEEVNRVMEELGDSFVEVIFKHDNTQPLGTTFGFLLERTAYIIYEDKI